VVSASSHPASKRHPSRRIGFWLIVAALVHAELLLVAGLCMYLLAPRNADLQKQIAERSGDGPTIDVGMVDEDAARQIIADLERQDEQRKAEEVKKEIESIKAPGQVVDIPVPREEKRPDEARFASEHDSTVLKETRKFGKFDEKAQQGDATGEVRPQRLQAPSQKPPDGRLAMREPTLGRALRPPGLPAPAVNGEQPGSRYGVAPDPAGASPENSLPQLGGDTPPRRATGGGAQAGATPSLMPSEEQLARAIGGGTQDALKDIDEGEETALNSKKWRFASFFNRVKKQVAEHWHPEEVYRRRDPTGAVYGHQNRYTLVRVQIRPDGTLANVSLEQPSGLEFLDDEAIEAFRQAQPFPNPPHQLIERSGLINFGLGFLLDLNGATKMRWFRYND
jgi:TonB family protein